MLRPRAWHAIAVLVACGRSTPASAPAADPEPPRQVEAAPVREPMSETSLLTDVRWLADPARRGRGSWSEDARLTARWIAGELREAGYAPVSQPIGTTDQVNVIATRGTGPALLIVAHYDHLGTEGDVLYPGADDNASGVAVALAVARELGPTPAGARVVFVFTGAEEAHLAGAKAYVAAPHVPLAETRAVINLDMVGRNLYGDTGSVQALAAVGLPADPGLHDRATAAAARVGLTLMPVEPGLLAAFGQARRSDDSVFREAGVVAIHLSSGITEDYHQPTDTIDKVSSAQLLRVARLVHALASAP
jgi:Zn-dependent M28 family amino/carboxypeptidase